MSADHPVRVVDAFVGSLDLGALGFGRVATEATGRPPYHPADLLKLYVYGYLNRIRSSRMLERECERNVEVLWLLGQLRPDFKTIANFRKENGQALRGVCGAFVRFCQRQGLVGGETVAIDGSKFAAAASQKSGAVTAAQVDRSIKEVETRIERYLSELDQNDAAEQEPTLAMASAATLEALREQRGRLQALAEEMIAAGQTRIVPGEPEATLMGREPRVIGYNVQTAVDAQHKLIVHHEVVREANDRRQLHPVASGAKQVLESERLQVLADSGYHNAEQAQKCEDEQIEPAVPSQRSSNQYGGYFPKDAFTYDEQQDTYRCPAGAVMKVRPSSTDNRRRRYLTNACGSCELRPQCTSGRRRQITRSVAEDAAERANERARDPKVMRQRSGLAEHPFAWLKRTLNGRFLSRGLTNVKAEIALAITAFNMLRVMKTIGTRRLLNLMCA